MNNRAQLTLFIIIGILVLLIVGVLVYFVYLPGVEEIVVPANIKPVYTAVVNCANSLAKDAITKQALQGGYLNIPTSIKRTPRSYLPLDSKGIASVPYWYYEGEDRTPRLEDMEKEVAKQVRDNLLDCVDNFESFKPQWSVVQKTELKPVVTYGDKDVIVDLDWVLDITTEGKVVTQEKYRTRLPVRVKKLRETADSLMKAENKDKFFEKFTIDLMSSDPEIPMDGLTFSCGRKRWQLPIVKQRLQENLQYNLPYVRVKNTESLPFLKDERVYEDLARKRQDMLKQMSQDVPFDKITKPTNTPDDAYDYFQMNFDAGIPPTDLKASFSYYPSFGLLITAQPNDGGVLKSAEVKGGKKYLRFLCVNQWHFTYDVIYPVLTTLRDDSAFDGTGFVFNMAFPVLINSNAPERVYFGLKRFTPVEYDTEYCSKLSDRKVEFRVLSFEEGAPFAVEQENANISFRCGNELCDLGKTKADEGNYKLVTKIPEGCGNPWIIAEQDGHLATQEYLLNGQDRLDLTLKSLKSMDVKVVKHRYNSVAKQFMDSGVLISDKEKLNIYWSFVNETYDEIKEYPRDTKLNFVNDNSNYDATLILRDRFDNIIGGYNSENLRVSYKEIKGKTKAVLHVLEYVPLPVNDQQNAEMVNVIYGTDFSQKLKPTFE